jgi:hypothetical protein
VVSVTLGQQRQQHIGVSDVPMPPYRIGASTTDSASKHLTASGLTLRNGASAESVIGGLSFDGER